MPGWDLERAELMFPQTGCCNAPAPQIPSGWGTTLGFVQAQHPKFPLDGAESLGFPQELPASCSGVCLSLLLSPGDGTEGQEPLFGAGTGNGEST